METMKTITEIAKTCDTSRDNAYSAAKRIGIIPAKQGLRIAYYDEYQEFLIIEHLWYIGKVDTLIFESKMNKPDPQESFADFKKRTYGRQNAITRK